MERAMSVITAKKETVTFNPTSQDNAASALGASLGAALQPELDILSKAKQDWEGGPFKVMFRLIKTMTDEQRDALPDTKARTGNNPRWYKVSVTGTDGKVKEKEHDYYSVVCDSLPSTIAKRNRIDMLNRSMNIKMNQADITEDIKDMKHERRYAEITRLSGEISNAKSAVVKAFELFHQFSRFEKLAGVTVSLIWAIGPDGKEMVDVEVDNTKTPIIIRTKLDSRKDLDWTRVGVGQFLSFDTAKAEEQGGSYAAVMATIKKGKKEPDKDGTANPKAINTIDTFSARMTDVAEFMTRVWEATDKTLFQALEKEADKDDDLFTNLAWVHAMLEDIVGSPKDKVRFQALINKETPKAKAS